MRNMNLYKQFLIHIHQLCTSLPPRTPPRTREPPLLTNTCKKSTQLLLRTNHAYLTNLNRVLMEFTPGFPTGITCAMIPNSSSALEQTTHPNFSQHALLKQDFFLLLASLPFPTSQIYNTGSLHPFPPPPPHAQHHRLPFLSWNPFPMATPVTRQNPHAHLGHALLLLRPHKQTKSQTASTAGPCHASPPAQRPCTPNSCNQSSLCPVPVIFVASCSQCQGFQDHLHFSGALDRTRLYKKSQGSNI